MARLREPDQLPCEARRTKDRIEEDSARRPAKQCAKCAGRRFHRHQKRLRWFLPVVERIVRPIRCWLYRWRCVSCGTTFTHLPTLCVPFKRYLRGEIETRARTYVETDPMSYRKVVTGAGPRRWFTTIRSRMVRLRRREKEAEAVRELAPSTPYRWIGAIAARREQWQPAVRLARQVHQGARLSLLMIAPAKYRSRGAQACA